MRTLSNEQLGLLKSWAIEALGEKGMNFNSFWLAQLKNDLNSDCACNAFELARYIAWHMEYHAVQYGMHLSDRHAESCAFQAVTFGLNEYIGEP